MKPIGIVRATEDEIDTICISNVLYKQRRSQPQARLTSWLLISLFTSININHTYFITIGIFDTIEPDS